MCACFRGESETKELVPVWKRPYSTFRNLNIVVLSVHRLSHCCCMYSTRAGVFAVLLSQLADHPRLLFALIGMLSEETKIDISISSLEMIQFGFCCVKCAAPRCVRIILRETFRPAFSFAFIWLLFWDTFLRVCTCFVSGLVGFVTGVRG